MNFNSRCQYIGEILQELKSKGINLRYDIYSKAAKMVYNQGGKIIEDKLKNNAKSFISKQVRKLESIETDIRMMVGSHFANEIRKEISENWETLGIQSVNHSMMKMTNEQIAQLEKYCEVILTPKEPLEVADMGLIEG